MRSMGGQTQKTLTLFMMVPGDYRMENLDLEGDGRDDCLTVLARKKINGDRLS